MKFIPSLLIAAPAAALLMPFSSPRNDYNLSMDASERTAVFARSDADFKNARILTATRARRGWSAPVPIPFSTGPHSDSDPWLTPDGRTLLFISDRPAPGREAGRTDYDIWRSTRTRRGWSAPEHLGSNVNSSGQELGPELHNGMLYFASARRSGRGGLDIYQARASGAGFAPAALMQGPFNSNVSDSDFTLRRDGRAAMFWRSQGERGVIHIAHRTASGWSDPTPLPPDINAGPFNFTPSFTRGGKVIYASTRERSGQPAGLADIYEANVPPR